MIGTEMALPYLTRPISVVGVLSVNSLLTIPDFRMGERVFRLLLSLRARADRRFIIQTRDKTDPLYALAAAGNIGEFTEDELAARKALGYPPFTVLIKLTYTGKKEEGERVMKDIEKTFAPFIPVTFPSFIARVKGAYRMNALMKIPVTNWPNDDLLRLLSSLPPDVDVRVDPESVI
jgi:primosomal protein N' (replication factor Y)